MFDESGLKYKARLFFSAIDSMYGHLKNTEEEKKLFLQIISAKEKLIDNFLKILDVAHEIREIKPEKNHLELVQ